MDVIEASYFRQLQQLLPPGPAFDLELQPDLAQMLAALPRSWHGLIKTTRRCCWS